MNLAIAYLNMHDTDSDMHDTDSDMHDTDSDMHGTGRTTAYHFD